MLSRIQMAIVCVLTLAFTACGPGPKSQMLDDLEQQLQDPSAKDVKEAPGAAKPYREARQYRRLSLEAWQDGKDELSEEYAVLGILRYRTAAAIAEQHENKTRLDAANAKVGGANPEIVAINQEQIKLNDEVAALQREVAQARRRKEEAERRANALQNQQNMQVQDQASGAKLTALNNKLREVETAKQKADAVNAQEHAPAKYNPADNQLKSIRTLLAGSRNASDQMLADAGNALNLFQQAAVEAEPKFKEAQEKLDPTVRRSKLRSDAEAVFGSTYVQAEPAGARVILADLFDTGGSSVRPSSSRLLEELAKLAQKYDEFSIFIEGFTSASGDATENLGLSQLRARAIKDYLTGAGVKGSRIETKGMGQDRIRYPREGSKNDRVEVSLTR